ncbi:MAG: hypothetical protein R2932_26075 [Caldilineaceae bacterium]
MTPYLLMAASALVLTLSGTPVMRLVALRFGVVDQPAARKIHQNPVPLLGGAAIYVALIIVLFDGRSALYSRGCRDLCWRFAHELNGVVDDRSGVG